MGSVVYFRAATEAQMLALAERPDTIDDFMFSGPNSELVDFDVAWHAVHFILTGSADATVDPISVIVDGREPVASGPIGSIEFWFVSPARVRAFHEALDALSDDVLKSRFDPAAMAIANVYRAEVFVEEGCSALGYLMQGVPSLRRLATRCVNDRLGLVKAVS